MTNTWRTGDFIHNRWQVHDIRKGGMALVYIVWDRKTHEPLAAKTFLTEDLAARKLFEREALNWINLDLHPNIVQARFVEHINSLPFLFLEYIAGGDLRQRMRHGTLTQSAAVTFGPRYMRIVETTDGTAGWVRYAANQRQFCWSHFTRNLLSAQELAKTPAAKRFCREALALQRRLLVCGIAFEAIRMLATRRSRASN
jgi:hypothetical protein